MLGCVFFFQSIQDVSTPTWSRLELLLCETQDSIFSYDHFNGQIEETSSKQFLSQERCHGGADLSIFNRRLTPLSTLGMGGARLLGNRLINPIFLMHDELRYASHII